MEARSCVIKPTVNINRNDRNSASIESPLYNVIYDILKPNESKYPDFSARDVAWDIYTKTMSKENIDKLENAMSQFPDRIMYYGETDDFTLPTLIWCTDIMSMLNFENLSDYLNSSSEYFLSSDNVEDVIDRVEEINNSEWGKIVTATVEQYIENNKIYFRTNFSINPVQEIDINTDNPSNTQHQDSPTERHNRYFSRIFKRLENVFKVLNFDEQVIYNLINELRQHDPNFKIQDFPLILIDTLVHIGDTIKGDSTESLYDDKSCLIIRYIIENSNLRNSALYSRLLNQILGLTDDDIARILGMSVDDVIATDNVRDLVFEKFIKQALYKINTNKGYANPNAERLMRQLFINMNGVSLCKIDNLINIVTDVNTELPNVQNILKNPNIKRHFKVDNVTQRLNALFESLVENLIRLEKIGSTFAIDLEKDKETKNFIDRIMSLQYQMEKATKNSSLQTLYPLLKQVLQTITSISSSNSFSRLDELIQTTNLNKADFSNNYLCGQLQLYKNIILYFQKCITDIYEMHEAEEDATTKLIDDNTLSKLDEMNSLLDRKKNYVLKAIRKVVINELKTYFGDKKFPRRIDGKMVTIEEYIIEGDVDLGYIESALDSAAMCDNVIIQIAQDYKKQLSDAAKSQTNDVDIEISAADKKLKKAEPHTRDHSFMFEQHNGYPTGKLVMDYDAAAYWYDFNEYKKELRKQGLSDETMYQLLQKFANDRLEKRDDLGGIYCPRRDMYGNNEFNSWSQAKKDYWKTFMSLKAKIVNSYPLAQFSIDDAIYYRPDNFTEQFIEAKTLKGKWKAFKDHVLTFRKYTSNDTDLIKPITNDFEGDEVMSLPLFYTNLFPGETMDSISKDLTRGLKLYADIIYTSSAVYDGINILNGVFDVLEYQKILQTAGNQNLKEVLEGYTFKKVKTLTRSKYDKNTLSRYKAYLTMQVYGQYSSSKEGKTGKSLANLYMKTVSQGTLALNINSNISNVLQGIMSFTPEMFAGEFFSKRDVAKAFVQYNRYVFDLKNSILNGLGSPNPNNYLALWLNYMDVLQDFKSDIKDKRHNQKWVNLLNSSPMFWLQNAGEHLLQSMTALSFANSDRYTLLDGNGKKINLFKAFRQTQVDGINHIELMENLYTNNGKRIVTIQELKVRAEKNNTKYTDITLIDNDTEVSELTWKHEMQEAILGLNQYMHGVYNQEDKNKIQHYALGRMAIMYRKYMKPALNRRFQKKYWNPQLQQEFEGYYRTGWNYIRNLSKEHKLLKNIDKVGYKDLEDYQRDHLINLGISASEFDSASKKTKQWLLLTNEYDVNEGMKAGIRRALLDNMSNHEKSNLKRVCSEFVIYQTLVLINLLLDLDDDDDDTWFMSKLKYLMRRLRTEVGALTPFSILGMLETSIIKRFTGNDDISVAGGPIQEMLQLITQPIPGIDLVSTIPNAIDLIYPETYETVIKKGKFAGHTQAYKIAATLPTPIRQVLRWNQQADIYATQYYNLTKIKK